MAQGLIVMNYYKTLNGKFAKILPNWGRAPEIIDSDDDSIGKDEMKRLCMRNEAMLISLLKDEDARINKIKNEIPDSINALKKRLKFIRDYKKHDNRWTLIVPDIERQIRDLQIWL